MLKKLLKDKQVDTSKFHFDKKETYTINELRDILEDHRRFTVGLHDDVVSEYFEEFSTEKAKEIEAVKKLAEERENKVKEVEGSIGNINELKSKIAEYEGKVKSYEEELKPVRTEKRKATANGLLKGLVASGAELDVYDQLGDALKEVEITEGEDAKEIAKKLTPILNPLFEAKPYLKPVVEVKKATDSEFKNGGKQTFVEEEEDDEDKFVAPKMEILA